MPEKDPNLWSYVLSFWRDLITAITSSQVWLGVILSMVMTYFRNLYDDEHKTTRKLIAESALSGGITLTITSVLDVFGLPSSAAICVGGAVGFLGVDFVRSKMRKFINKKINDGDDHV